MMDGFMFAFSILLLAAYVLWDRRYRNVWREARSRKWQRVEGKFDEGEVITMMKGRSNTIAGYSVWMGYEYGRNPKSRESYADLFMSREFPEKEQAEAYRKKLENRVVPVRVSPRNAKHSYVLESDLPAAE